MKIFCDHPRICNSFKYSRFVINFLYLAYIRKYQETLLFVIFGKVILFHEYVMSPLRLQYRYSQLDLLSSHISHPEKSIGHV
jgi:hypothetical protein